MPFPAGRRTLLARFVARSYIYIRRWRPSWLGRQPIGLLLWRRQRRGWAPAAVL